MGLQLRMGPRLVVSFTSLFLCLAFTYICILRVFTSSYSFLASFHFGLLDCTWPWLFKQPSVANKKGEEIICYSKLVILSHPKRNSFTCSYNNGVRTYQFALSVVCTNTRRKVVP